MKASDISDKQMLEAVRGEMTCIGASFWNVAKRFPNFPEKVVRAKIHALLRRRWLTGCCCGCRGDFMLTQKALDRKDLSP